MPYLTPVLATANTSYMHLIASVIAVLVLVLVTATTLNVSSR
jgi:hypothetical protein